ncbi:MAG: hypothetical protein ABR511_10095 [Acidimicrobiales bacterium]
MEGLVAEVGEAAQLLPGRRPWRPRRAGPTPPPASGAHDPAAADALAGELSISELLSEDLPIPESDSDDRLSIRELLAEDLQYPDAATGGDASPDPTAAGAPSPAGPAGAGAHDVEGARDDDPPDGEDPAPRPYRPLPEALPARLRGRRSRLGRPD